MKHPKVQEQARQKKRLSSGSAASGKNVESDAPVEKVASTRKASVSKEFKSTVMPLYATKYHFLTAWEGIYRVRRRV